MNRRYPSSTWISDGSQIIFGGALSGGFDDVPALDNATLEFFPKKGIVNQSIASSFWMPCLQICFLMCLPFQIIIFSGCEYFGNSDGLTIDTLTSPFDGGSGRVQ